MLLAREKTTQKMGHGRRSRIMLGFNEKRGKKIIPGRETEKKSDTERGGKKTHAKF